MSEVKNTQLDNTEDNQRDPKKLYELSFAYRKQQNYTKALELLNRALQEDNGNSDIYYEVANIYKELNLTNKALNYYKDSIKYDQKYIKAYYAIASILSDQKQYNGVIAIYKMVLEFAEDDIKANFDLAYALYKSQEYGESILYFEKVLHLDSKNIEAYKYLCESYNRQKRYKDALACNLRAVELYPNESKYYYNLAVTFENLDKKDEAIEYLEKAVELYPNYTDALSLLVKLKNEKSVINIGLDWGSDISLMKFAPFMLSYDLKIYSLRVGQNCADIESFGLEDEDISQKLTMLDNLAEAISKVDIVITADMELAKISSKMDRVTWVICGDGEDDYLDLYPNSRLFHCDDGYESAINDLFVAFEKEYSLKLKR
jgi:tetratricopeptide (TPR) repeat protein